MVAIESAMLQLLIVFCVAAGARFVAERLTTVSYPILLVATGVAISVSGLEIRLALTHDVILFVILPTILFFGAIRLDLVEFRQHLATILPLVGIGLPLAVVALGLASWRVFEFPLVIALLFAATIYPLDPVAILSVFTEMDAPERLAAVVEGESLLDDGVAIVLFSTVIDLYLRGYRTDVQLLAFLDSESVASVVSTVIVVSFGGLLVGGTIGAVVTAARRRMDDYENELLLTAIAAYGSFLLANHYLGVSGVLATVAAGLTTGVAEKKRLLGEESMSFVESVWDEAEFLANTVVYVLIGSQVRVHQLVEHADLVALGALLVLGARALVVYTITGLTNRVLPEPIPLNLQHVMVWGALHTVVPVALVLAIPPEVPYREELRTMVFGVAIVSVVVQGLLMPYVLRAVGATSETQ